MAKREYSPDQSQLFGYQAHDRLPEGHICFLIDDVIEDLNFAPAARGNAVLGAPTYEPRMMLKVLCHGYVRGIRSSRKLAAECVENIGFIHLCRGDAPSYRTIIRFRAENGPLLSSTFSELIGRMAECGLVSGRHIIVDGTKIKANASNRKVLDRRYFAVVKEKFERWMSASAEIDAVEDEAERSSSGVPDELGVLFEKYVEAASEGEAAGVERVSLTDKESRFMRDSSSGKIGLSYNVQVAVDAETGIIVACDATNEASDSHSLGSMVEAAEASCDDAVEAVDGDCGYFESNQIRKLEASGVDVCVADGHTKSALDKGSLSEFIRGGEFPYDSERDVFNCPFGNEHVFKGICTRKDGKSSRVYETRGSCKGCPRRKKCLCKSRSRFHRIERTVEHVWLHEYRQRFLEPEYQERLRKRGLIEHNFGHLKHNLGFRMFLLRGLCGAKIETFLACLASVLRRVCNVLERIGCSWRALMRTGIGGEPRAA